MTALILLAAGSVCPAAAQAEFSTRLWDEVRPLYRQTLRHPFLRGLADGTLPRSRFLFYLAQDAAYLWEFSRALHILAAKAPRPDWAVTLSQHAVDALKTERRLHESLLPPAPPVELTPTARAYTNHLLATVCQRPFPEGLAALLPCYWIYWEAGKELKKRGSPNRDYQRWIDQYADPAFGAAVSQVLAMMNEEARQATPATLEAARRLFVLSARYEYLFWDMAWREERWAP